MRRIGWIAIAALALIAASCNRDEQSKQLADEHADHTTAAASTATAPPAATRSDELVRFGDASGYLALPASAEAKKPAIIVIQEWWGVDDWIREQTARFAEQGYVALAPDLYRGRRTNAPEEAHELARGLPEDRAMADLKAAVDYLSTRADVDPNRIGVIGWCMGGGYALKLATVEPRVKAAAVNYGSLVTDDKAITRIQSQILGNFGADDRGIPAEDVKAFGQNLTKYGKLGDIKIYDGAGHAFMNPNNKQGYNEAAALDAQDRIDRFFDRTLRATISNS
ncbi:MAG TPA: dienelactone hydrolase family protein [Thermoanaerobaculia bacterium]|jgi:carboxymethylenebutenolidase|nr:dienelactone hydrolase family protein [Thermoanaerobaculia bacterium]